MFVLFRLTGPHLLPRDGSISLKEHLYPVVLLKDNRVHRCDLQNRRFFVLRCMAMHLTLALNVSSYKLIEILVPCERPLWYGIVNGGRGVKKQLFLRTFNNFPLRVSKSV